MIKKNKLPVFLDANILSWLYSPNKSTPKKFNKKEEVAVLRRLGSFNNPEIEFIYNNQETLKKFIDNYGAAILKDFKCFTALDHIIFANEAKANVEEFRNFLKNTNEKQDDIIEVLPGITFYKEKIQHIITLDKSFINRLCNIHNKIKKNTNFERWLLDLRPDFYKIIVLFPTEFENLLSNEKLA